MSSRPSAVVCFCLLTGLVVEGNGNREETGRGRERREAHGRSDKNSNNTEKHWKLQLRHLAIGASILGAVFLMLCVRCCCLRPKRTLTITGSVQFDGAIFRADEESVTLQRAGDNNKTGGDQENNNEAAESRSSAASAQALSKVENTIVSISGVTVEETVTEIGVTSTKVITDHSGSGSGGAIPGVVHRTSRHATLRTGSCYYERDSPQVLYVYDNYPPGFGESLCPYLQRPRYDYVFSLEDLDQDTSHLVEPSQMSIHRGNRLHGNVNPCLETEALQSGGEGSEGAAEGCGETGGASDTAAPEHPKKVQFIVRQDSEI